jgi:hypothetical protein
VNFLSKRWQQANVFTIFLLSLLFLTLLPSTAVAQQTSHAPSLGTWTIDDMESPPKPTPQDHLMQRTRLLNFVLPVNRIFRFDLPPDMFGSVAVIQHYQVHSDRYTHGLVSRNIVHINYRVGAS